MKKITKLMAASLCGLALSACGGDGGDTVAPGAVEACFTVPETVSFWVDGFNANGESPVGSSFKRTAGPGVFNGQAATQSETTDYAVFPGFPETSRSIEYWAVTDSGVALLGQTMESYDGGSNSAYIANPAPVIPLNIQPGQSVNFASAQVVAANFDVPASFTFMGLETLTLSGRTFSDVCHFRLQGTPADAANPVTTDFWYAPGFGEIQRGDTDGVFRYSGDLS